MRARPIAERLWEKIRKGPGEKLIIALSTLTLI